MSSNLNKSVDMAGPILGRVFNFTIGQTLNLIDYRGMYITLIPSADMTLVMSADATEAAALTSGVITFDGDDKPVAHATRGVTIPSGQRIDFRLPTRLGKRGEVFLGTDGTGTCQCWLSNYGG